VSIVLPVRNEGAAFRACLDGIRRLEPRCEDVVVVVDGGGAPAAAAAQDAGARVIRLPGPPGGPAAARNAGARAARGDILCFLDADVIVPPDLLARVGGAFEGHPEIDAIIGSYDDAPAATNFLSQYKNLAHHFLHQTSRVETSSFFSGCGAIRRAAFERVGGFDERYRRPSIEDIELGSRLHAAGCRVRIEKTLQVTHLKRWTPWGLLETEIRDRAIPWTQLILRSRSMPNELNIRWRGRVAVACASFLAMAAVTAPWLRGSRMAAPMLAATLLVIDRDVFRFFRARRGAAFAIRAILAHWVHYLCSAIGFLAGTFLHLIGANQSRPAAAPRKAEADRA
jgi:GT2 family glycosyltransferase